MPLADEGNSAEVAGKHFVYSWPKEYTKLFRARPTIIVELYVMEINSLRDYLNVPSAIAI